MVDKATANKRFHIDLPHLGPYSIDYSQNGKWILIGGYKGHVAAFDWKAKQLLCEVGVVETVHDVA